MTVNDGKGLYDNHGMIALLTKRLDELADASGVRKCVLIVDAVNMLKSLDSGLSKEEKAHQEEVDSLTKQLEELLNNDKDVKNDG